MEVLEEKPISFMRNGKNGEKKEVENSPLKQTYTSCIGKEMWL